MVNLLLRVSVLFGLAGMAMGIAMGIKQDFSLVPAHAHMNLLGFVTLFLSGLYYRSVPAAAACKLAKVQTALAVTGAVIFPVGIASVLLGDHEKYLPIVVGGSLIVLAAMALLAVIVFRTNNATSAT
jgi:hypothetical protein